MIIRRFSSCRCFHFCDCYIHSLGKNREVSVSVRLIVLLVDLFVSHLICLLSHQPASVFHSHCTDYL